MSRLTMPITIAVIATVVTLAITIHGSVERIDKNWSTFVTYLQTEEGVDYKGLDDMYLGEIMTSLKTDHEVSQEQYDRILLQYAIIQEQRAHDYDSWIMWTWIFGGIGIAITGLVMPLIIDGLMAEKGICANCQRQGNVYRITQRWVDEPAYCKKCWKYHG
jgi:hypothetical protein